MFSKLQHFTNKNTKKGKKSSYHLVPDLDLSCTDANVEETVLTSKGTPLQTYTGLQRLVPALLPPARYASKTQEVGKLQFQGRRLINQWCGCRQMGHSSTASTEPGTMWKWLSLCFPPPPFLLMPGLCHTWIISSHTQYILSMAHRTFEIQSNPPPSQ